MRVLCIISLFSALLMGCASGERSEVAVDSSAAFAGLQTPTDAVPLLVLGKDSRALPAGWQPWVLHPTKAQTRYRVVRDAEVGAVVSAEADASASGLLRELNLEVSRAPVLEWQWRIDSLIEGADNTDRYAEDSPVRIVLAFDGDKQSLPMRDRLFFERTRLLGGREMPYATLMYIWENRQPVGSVLKNPHTDRVRKLVVASGAEGVGRWQKYRRNVVDDFTAAYGKPPGPLIGIAILTDTDNTRQRARAQYGSVRLVPAATSSAPGGPRAQVP
jgi:hypothetical protein